MTLTGRTPAEPNIQNIPGSLAHTLSWAFETGDFTKVVQRIANRDFSPKASDSDVDAAK